MSAIRTTTDTLAPGCALEVWGDNTVWVTVPAELLSAAGERVVDGGLERRRLPLRDFLRWRRCVKVGV